MEINDLGVVQRTLKFKEDNRVKAIRAVQGETARTIVFNLVDGTGAAVDASKYTLDMVIAIKGFTDEVMAKGNAEGEFTVTLPQSMLSVYGKGLAQLTIREGEQALSTISCRIEIAQNIKYEGSGVNLMFSFNELRDKLTILEGLVEDGTKALNTTLEARDTVQTKADLVNGIYIELKEAENNEAKRKTNETARQTDETTRQTNEDARVASEKQRTIKEDERLVSEGLRVLNEASRVDAEEYRESSEGVRAAQEEERLANENARLDNEILRQTSETQREVNELKRKSNEDIRISAEDKRVTEEAVRVENEKQRGSKFSIWSKTLDDIETGLDATDTNKGLVKVSSSDGETAPYTVVSVGRLKEELLSLGLTEEDVKAVVDTKVATLKEELLNLGLTEDEVKAVVDSKVATLREELQTLITGVDSKIVPEATIDTKIDSAKTELGTQISELNSKVGTQYLDTNTSLDAIESDVAKKQDKLTAGDNIDITGDTISAVDTIYDDSGIKADIDTKQDKLVAGDNIDIDPVSNTISGTAQYDDTQVKADVAKKQDKLTAGDNIDITGDIISAVDTIYNDTQIKAAIAEKQDKLTTWDIIGMVDNVYNNTQIKADVAEKQDKLTAGANVQIAGAKNTISATDTITTINGKTGVISKADIVALGIPSQDTNTTYSEITTAEIDTGTASTLRTITGRRIKYILDKIQGWIGNLTKADVGLNNVDNVKQATKVEFDSHGTNTTMHITNTERTNWDTKETTTGSQDKANQAEQNAKSYVDGKVLTDVPINAKFTDTVYSHPSSHPASMITESSTKRFATDAEKLKWNGGVVPNIGNFISQEQLIGYVIMNQLSSGLYKTGIGDASDSLLLIHAWNKYYETTVYTPDQIVYAKVSKTGDILDFQDVWNKHLYRLNQVDNKVDKVTGKQLSTEDYTSAEKTKLSGIAAGANNYTHPISHPISMITGLQSALNKKVETDTVTTINGKTGAISKADIIALGIPSQDTVYKKPSSEPMSYIQGLQAELDSKVESYGTNPVLNIAVINAGDSTTSIPNNTLILELE